MFHSYQPQTKQTKMKPIVDRQNAVLSSTFYFNPDDPAVKFAINPKTGKPYDSALHYHKTTKDENVGYSEALNAEIKNLLNLILVYKENGKLNAARNFTVYENTNKGRTIQCNNAEILFVNFDHQNRIMYLLFDRKNIGLNLYAEVFTAFINNLGNCLKYNLVQGIKPSRVDAALQQNCYATV